MLVLEWDEDLAAVAQSHANQCQFQHDCYQCRRTDKYSTVGQNIYLHQSSRPSVRTRWHDAIHHWYNELNIAPKSIVSQFQPRQLNIGHFTQIVWANTSKIGCGFVAYAVPNSIYKVAHLYTCNYAPAGNYIGLQTYQVGAPASRCPTMTKPSFHYKALCKPYQHLEVSLTNGKRVDRKHHKHRNHIMDNKTIIVKKVSQKRVHKYYSTRRRHRYYRRRTNYVRHNV